MNNKKSTESSQTVGISVGRAEMLISGMTSEQTDRIYEIINNLLDEDNSISGSADDFHNISVSLVSKVDDYETSLEIIQKGLEIHPSNTDLIADAIRYGSNCGKYKECDKWCEKLLKITKRRWTWRAFSFLIDYLLESLDRYEEISDEEYDSKFQEILTYVKEYQQKYSDYEDSWYSEFEVYWNTNERFRAKEILKKISESDMYCPKIWLRYADMLIDEGKFFEAEPLLEKLRNDGNIAENRSAPYIYYLHGKCKFQKIVMKKEYDDDTIEDAYKTFNLALKAANPDSELYNKIQEAKRRLDAEIE